MTQSPYATTAYSSADLQRQTPGKSRSGLKQLTGQRLPWGNTQEIAPDSFMMPEPSSLRSLESDRLLRDEQIAQGTYKPAPMEHIDFHDRCDHEHYRHAPWGSRAHFWLYLGGFGKGGFFICLFLAAVAAVFETSIADQNHLFVFYEAFSSMFYIFSLPCLVAWMLAVLVIHKFPRLWIKPGKGPKWELNRRTGMVTVLEYCGGEVSEKRAPFHEFDAYVNTTPDRQGLPMNVLSIEHRYSDISIHFGDIQPPDRNVNQHCALWDFIQNYMDTSHALPDTPLFEEHRANDATTAEHDKAAGRIPRYWRDMGDEVFKQAQSHMRAQIARINTLSRQNLAA